MSEINDLQLRTEPDRELFRHALATLAYRAGKAMREAPPEFGDFRAAPGARSPLEIVAHMGDLMEWALSFARGEPTWNPAEPQRWDAEVTRFFTCLRALDDYLASDQPIGRPLRRIFQGPVADALTHVGQLMMLRRIIGSPLRAENFYGAEIMTGQVGPEQQPPRMEFG